MAINNISHQQDDDDPDGHHIDGFAALDTALVGRHADEDRDHPERVDDRQQPDKHFYIFCIIEHIVHLRDPVAERLHPFS
jgi:hypothetical protein